MAVRHTITRQQAEAIALQVDPDFDVSSDFTVRLNTDGGFAHVSLGKDRTCIECARHDAKLAAEEARKRAEGREDEI